MQSKQVKLLEKIGTLQVIPGTDFSTTKQVAEFFDVKTETIQKVIQRNREILIKNQLTRIKGEEIKKLKSALGGKIDGTEKINKELLLFKTNTIIKSAFLLTSSEKAKQLKQEVFNFDKELYSELSHTTTLRSKKKEEFCFENIRLNFPQVKIERQKKIKNYSVDFCLNDSIYLEIDESGHSGYDDKKEKQRTETIEAEIGKKLVRFNPDKQEPFELILTIAEVLKCNQ